VPKVIERLATKPWLELTGSLTAMGAATAAVLLDISRSRSYDPVQCATAGGHHCDEPLLPTAIAWGLVAVGVAAVLLVFVAIGLKVSRRAQDPPTQRDAGT
jgi:hypothetical protein